MSLSVITIWLALILLFASLLIPNSGVYLNDIISGKIVPGSEEFKSKTKNVWIAWMLTFFALMLLIGGITCL